MSTDAQINANRENAQLSTGPTSPEGKAVSSRNAITHACTAQKAVILAGEQSEYEKMKAGLKTDLHPLGQLQVELFETMVLATWNQRRCRLAEIKVMAQCEQGVDPLLDPDKAKQLDRISLYSRRHDAAFHRALRALRQLQTEWNFRKAVLPIGKGIDEHLGVADSFLIRKRMESEIAKVAEAQALAEAMTTRRVMDIDVNRINRLASDYLIRNYPSGTRKSEPDLSKING